LVWLPSPPVRRGRGVGGEGAGLLKPLTPNPSPRRTGARGAGAHLAPEGEGGRQPSLEETARRASPRSFPITTPCSPSLHIHSWTCGRLCRFLHVRSGNYPRRRNCTPCSR